LLMYMQTHFGSYLLFLYNYVGPPRPGPTGPGPDVPYSRQSN
jgi:hypothetical protein